MSKQASLDLSSKSQSPVECLGQSFPSDEARREHYLKLLAEKLKDPEFRKIEGFPIGEDEDILALSDPPYYTACPNPWIGDFIKHYGRPYDPKEKYHREPFAADVSEGKNHPIYNAHSYHTKVPHRAIMRYILHYTEPGDVVFDGFCGTGMTGVAAQLCGDRKEVQELGYRVDEKGIVFDETGKAVSKLGARQAILNDLSPAATFIAGNYNTTVDTYKLNQSASNTLAAVENELSWMCSTVEGATENELSIIIQRLKQCRSLEQCRNFLLDTGSLLKETGLNSSKIKIMRLNFVVWTDYFACENCAATIESFGNSILIGSGQTKDKFPCPECGSEIQKGTAKKVFEKVFDHELHKSIEVPRSEPAYVCYFKENKKIRRTASRFDTELAKKIAELPIETDVPIDLFLNKGEKWGDSWRAGYHKGIENTHHFYHRRNLFLISALWSRLERNAKWLVTSFVSRNATKLNRFIVNSYNLNGRINGPLSGTLYVSAETVEQNALGLFKESILTVGWCRSESCIATSSASDITLPNESLDYIFIDPPFGGNLMYSELNFIIESWLHVKTQQKPEAITNDSQLKGLSEYQSILLKCFRRCYAALKPGRWLTLEFSSSQASVWNAIQTTLQEAGFVVANVAALDKKHGGIKSFTNPTSVKQDLVISAYKPNGGLEERFHKSSATAEGIWDFMHAHLRNLPIVKPRGGELEFIAERDPRILYDRMVAFYVGHGVPVPLSSAEFQAALAEKFPEREGMFFLPDQVDIWDKKRAQVQGVGQMSIFVEDEKSAIDWLRSFLKNRPSVAADIAPEFMQQLGASWKKFETRPELRLLLEQNFLKYDGNGEVPGQIHGYLSTQFKDLRNLAKDDSHLQSRAKDRWYVPDPGKAVDVEAVRNKRLLAEFWDLCAQAGINRPASEQSDQGRLPFPAAAPAKKGARKKLKEVRTEAVRLGFKECFAAKNYATILALSEHLPENVIEEDEQLQMIHDMAEMRAEG